MTRLGLFVTFKFTCCSYDRKKS